jgi:hypothetical protein
MQARSWPAKDACGVSSAPASNVATATQSLMTSLRFGRAFNKASDDLARKLAWSANQNQDGSHFRAHEPASRDGQIDSSIAMQPAWLSNPANRKPARS